MERMPQSLASSRAAPFAPCHSQRSGLGSLSQLPSTCHPPARANGLTRHPTCSAAQRNIRHTCLLLTPPTAPTSSPLRRVGGFAPKAGSRNHHAACAHPCHPPSPRYGSLTPQLLAEANIVNCEQSIDPVLLSSPPAALHLTQTLSPPLSPQS